jgi:hypothetical protein
VKDVAIGVHGASSSDGTQGLAAIDGPSEVKQFFSAMRAFGKALENPMALAAGVVFEGLGH